jgi:hypothetical protein
MFKNKLSTGIMLAGELINPPRLKRQLGGWCENAASYLLILFKIIHNDVECK